MVEHDGTQRIDASDANVLSSDCLLVELQMTTSRPIKFGSQLFQACLQVVDTIGNRLFGG